jgi:hypothetical protein
VTDPIWHLQIDRKERALILTALRYWRERIAQSRAHHPHLRTVNPSDSGLEALVERLEAVPETKDASS